MQHRHIHITTNAAAARGTGHACSQRASQRNQRGRVGKDGGKKEGKRQETQRGTSQSRRGGVSGGQQSSFQRRAKARALCRGQREQVSGLRIESLNEHWHTHLWCGARCMLAASVSSWHEGGSAGLSIVAQRGKRRVWRVSVGIGGRRLEQEKWGSMRKLLHRKGCWKTGGWANPTVAWRGRGPERLMEGALRHAGRAGQSATGVGPWQACDGASEDGHKRNVSRVEGVQGAQLEDSASGCEMHRERRRRKVARRGLVKGW